MERKRRGGDKREMERKKEMCVCVCAKLVYNKQQCWRELLSDVLMRASVLCVCVLICSKGFVCDW